MYNGFFIRSPLSFLEKKKKCIKNNVTRFLTRSNCVDDYIKIATANSSSFLNDNKDLITNLKNTRGLFGKRKRIRLLKELTDKITKYNKVNQVNQETTHANPVHVLHNFENTFPGVQPNQETDNSTVNQETTHANPVDVLEDSYDLDNFVQPNQEIDNSTVNQQETTHKNGSNDNDYEIDYEMFKTNKDFNEDFPNRSNTYDNFENTSLDEQDPSDVVEPNEVEVSDQPLTFDQRVNLWKFNQPTSSGEPPITPEYQLFLDSYNVEDSDEKYKTDVEKYEKNRLDKYNAWIQKLTLEERVNLWKFNRPIIWGQPPITPAYRSFLNNYNVEDSIDIYNTDVERYEKFRLDKEFGDEYNAWIQTPDYKTFKKGFMEGSLRNYNNLENYAIKHFLTKEKQERKEQERQRKKQERKKQEREKRERKEQEREEQEREEQEREKQEQEREKREREKREREKQEQEKREREEQKLKEQDSRALEQERIKRMNVLTEINKGYESSFDELDKKIDKIKKGNDVDYNNCLQDEREKLMNIISELEEVNDYTFYATERTLKRLTLKCKETKMEKILVEMNQYEAIRKQIEEIQGYLDQRIGNTDHFSDVSVKETQLEIRDKFDGLLERMKNNKNDVANNLMRINAEIDILENAPVDLDNALSSDFEKDTIFRFLQKRELTQDKSKIRRENKGGRRTRKQKYKRFSRIKRKLQKHKSKKYKYGNNTKKNSEKEIRKTQKKKTKRCTRL
jgi:hypothetical protein